MFILLPLFILIILVLLGESEMAVTTQDRAHREMFTCKCHPCFFFCFFYFHTAPFHELVVVVSGANVR